MKHLACVVAGVAILTIAGFFVSSGLSYVYEMKFAKSQDNMDSFAVFLVCVLIPIFSVAGGFLGSALYRRNLTSRYSGRANVRH